MGGRDRLSGSALTDMGGEVVDDLGGERKKEEELMKNRADIWGLGGDSGSRALNQPELMEGELTGEN